MKAEHIAQSLGKFTTKQGGGFMACCPAHDDSNPSLSIDDADNGGVLVKCWSGCSQEALVSALKERGLWPEREHSSEQTTPAVKPKVVGRYNYPAADGNILYWKERLEPGRGGRSKEFRFRHVDPATKENAFGHGKHNLHVLYNLPNVLKAKSVIFTEGERLVDLLAEWGLVGTTLDAGSASRLTGDQIEQLSGKRIAILRDADEPGFVYAQNLACDLSGKCESLKVILLPGLELKEDFREWRDRPGNDKAALLEIIKGADEWGPTPAITTSSKAIVSPADQWPEPSPLPEGLPPVKALEPAMIPAPLRGWLMDISDRMQIPPDFSTAAAVVALGSITGRACGIHPKRHDDWLVIPNLWGGVVGRPSLMKTPAITEAQRHLVRLETEARTEFQNASQAQGIESEIEKITRSAICEEIKKAVKKGEAGKIEKARAELLDMDNGDVPDTRRRFQTQDGTTEKIGELLIENPRGLLVNRDELIGWFHSLDKPGREGDRAFYLEAWNGTRGYTYDRIGRGTLDIDALCVSIFGAITPGPLSDYVYQAGRGGNGDDGLLQRFQVMVWPDTPNEWRNVDRFPDTIEKNRAWEIFKALSGSIPGAIKEDGADIPALRFTPAGQEVFDSWRNELEKRLRGDHGLPPSMESHLAKYRSLMPSLALIFHLVEMVDGTTTAGPVSERAALMAAAWCDYLESHAGRVYGGAMIPGMESAREIIKHIKRGAIQDGATVRELWRHQWSRITNTEEAKAGLEVLAEYDWLTLEKITTGGRSSEAIRLNPRIKL